MLGRSRSMPVLLEEDGKQIEHRLGFYNYIYIAWQRGVQSMLAAWWELTSRMRIQLPLF